MTAAGGTNGPTASPVAAGGPAAAPGPPAWLPSAFTVARLGLIPVFLWLAVACRAAVLAGEAAGGLRVAAVATLVVMGLTDKVDGILARRYGLATQLGAVLDAAADKAAQVSLLVFFALQDSPAFPAVPLWFLGVVLARDLIMATGWATLRMTVGEARVEHRSHGRISTALMFAFLVWVAADLPAAGVPVGAAALTLLVAVSTVSYAREGFGQLRRAKSAAAGTEPSRP